MIKKQLEQINIFENYLQNLSDDSIQAALLKEDFYNFSIQHADSNLESFSEHVQGPQSKLMCLIQDFQPQSFEMLEEIERRLYFMSQLSQQNSKIDYIKKLFYSDEEGIKKSKLQLKHIWPLILQHLEDNDNKPEQIVQILKPHYYQEMPVQKVIQDLIRKVSQRDREERQAKVHLSNLNRNKIQKYTKQMCSNKKEQTQKIDQTDKIIEMLENFASLIDQN